MQRKLISNLINLNLKNLPISESIKTIQTTMELAAKDTRKYIEYLDQLDGLASSGLNFQQIQSKKTKIIYDLKRLAERTAENQETIAQITLEDMQRQIVDLEQIIGDMPSQIDERFVFYNFDLSNDVTLQVKNQFQVDSFNHLVELVQMPKWKYTYYHLEFGPLNLLLCQYMPVTTQTSSLSIPVAKYSDPAKSFLKSIQHRWGKSTPVKREVIHLFTPSEHRLGLDMGALLQTEAREFSAYQPHKSDEAQQLPKIIYDFINMYGINGHYAVHLFRQRNRSLIFLAPTLIEPAKGVLAFGTHGNSSTESSTGLVMPQTFLV